jgi:hypothetical protein
MASILVKNTGAAKLSYQVFRTGDTLAAVVLDANGSMTVDPGESVGYEARINNGRPGIVAISIIADVAGTTAKVFAQRW